MLIELFLVLEEGEIGVFFSGVFCWYIWFFWWVLDVYLIWGVCVFLDLLWDVFGDIYLIQEVEK